MITITPEYWAQPDAVKYHYKRPDGTLWNVSKVDKGIASIWTVNAWGVVYHEACAVSELTAITHETNVEAFDRIRKERRGNMTHDELIELYQAGKASLPVDRINHREFVYDGTRYFVGYSSEGVTRYSSEQGRNIREVTGWIVYKQQTE